MFNWLFPRKIVPGGFYKVDDCTVGPVTPAERRGYVSLPNGREVPSESLGDKVPEPLQVLHIGGWYKTRSGKVVGPLQYDLSGTCYQFRTEYNSWACNGRSVGDDYNSATDIVDDATGEEIAAEQARRATTDVDPKAETTESTAVEDEEPEDDYEVESDEPFWSKGDSVLGDRPTVTVRMLGDRALRWTPAAPVWTTIADAERFLAPAYEINDAIARGDKVFWLKFDGHSANCIVLANVITVEIINMPEGFNYGYRQR